MKHLRRAPAGAGLDATLAAPTDRRERACTDARVPFANGAPCPFTLREPTLRPCRAGVFNSSTDRDLQAGEMSRPATRPVAPAAMSRPGPTSDWRDRGRALGIAVAAGLFLAFSGAFGSIGAPLVTRLAYWVPLMAVGTLWGRAAAGLVFGRDWLGGRVWAQAGVTTLLIAGPFVPVVWAATALVFGMPLRLASLPFYVLPVLAVAAVMTAVNVAVGLRPRETHAAPAEDGPPRFLERLPLKLRGAELYAVEAEDHYLRIHTDRGSDLILLRLSDAVAELEGLEGARTHRSWWVAKAAVTGAERGDGRATLTLKNGAKAPVSRSYARALRAAGWY
jgi:hypothetical protein